MSDDELLFDLGPGFCGSKRGAPLFTSKGSQAEAGGPSQQSAHGSQLDQENTVPQQRECIQEANKISSRASCQQQAADRVPMHSQQARLSATGRGPGTCQHPPGPLSPCSSGTVDVSEELRSPPQLLSSPEVARPSFGQTSAVAQQRKQGGAGGKAKATNRSAASQAWDDMDADLAGEAPPPKKRSTAGSRLTDEEREANRKAAENEKEAKRAAREVDKEAKRLRKEREKADKANQTQENKAMREMMKQAAKVARAQDREEVQRCKGNFALNEIRVLLDNRFAASRSCRPILEALETNKQSSKSAPLECLIKEAMPMRPYKSALWERFRPNAVAASSQGAVGGSRGKAETILEQVPYVMVFFEAAELVAEVQRDKLQGLMRKAAAAHPGYTLGILAEGLAHHCDMRERRENGAFDTRPIYKLIDSLGIIYPGVRYRLARDAAEMADHVLRLTRALARLPYNKEASLLDVYGGKQNTEKIGQLNQTHPLGSFERKTWFEAIGVIPHLAPNAAHAIASKHPSLGNLLSIYLDPSRSMAANAKLLDGLPSAAGGNRVGATTSKKVFSILTASDPDQIVDELC
ncbi:hypothetical protein WJX74_000915 [Apatococcus lobatus]|uniref:ERCC4 domain-containing protein n=1 Tax=Apatococcus lobatus TaxID=904363 RepID=A0AAW1RSJ4_9CHLO